MQDDCSDVDQYDYTEYNDLLGREQEDDDDNDMLSRGQSALNSGYREAGSSMFQESASGSPPKREPKKKTGAQRRKEEQQVPKAESFFKMTEETFRVIRKHEPTLSNR